MKIHNYLNNIIKDKGAAYLVLIDPDKFAGEPLSNFVKFCEQSGVDGFLVGGSLIISNRLEETIQAVKQNCDLPVILFPGSESQLNPLADAVLFISLISGRNAEHLIGKHVIAAPIIKHLNLEPISTGYMIIESGKQTTAQYMSGSSPIPRNKPEIAAATALAAQYLGMKFIYLEGGSGAENSVPNEMIKMVSSTVSIPVIVGGGIKDSRIAREKIENGANIIITGNLFEDESKWSLVKEFANAVHINDQFKI